MGSVVRTGVCLILPSKKSLILSPKGGQISESDVYLKNKGKYSRTINIEVGEKG